MKVLRMTLFISIMWVMYPIFPMEEKQNSDYHLTDGQLISAAIDHDLVGVCHALKNGANVNAIDKSGNTALMYACFWLLKKTWLNYDVKAAFKKQRAVVKVLLKFQADLNKKNILGETALLIAADSAHKKHRFFNSRLVQILIEAGAKTKHLLNKDENYQAWAQNSVIDKYTDKNYRPWYAPLYSCFPHQ
jgi:hypothetical protein